MEKETLKAFGELFKNRRQSLGYTLRQFCLEKGLDPGNISRMERGLMPPPQKTEKLEEYASYLEIPRGSDEWYEFFDLAHIASSKIPSDLMGDEELVRKLPVLFRTVRDLDDEKLDALIELIRRA